MVILLFSRLKNDGKIKSDPSTSPGRVLIIGLSEGEARRIIGAYRQHGLNPNQVFHWRKL
jgi:hypothetical protein